MSRSILTYLVPLLLLIGACREFPVEVEEEPLPGNREFAVSINQPFEMAIGDVVQLQGQEMQLRFAIVTEDNRCPTEVQCIQRGRAGVLLEVTDHQDVTTQVLMHIPGLVATPYTNGDIIQHKGQRFRLLRLNPYPSADSSTAEADYRALLKVESAL